MLRARVHHFLSTSIASLRAKTASELIDQRYKKFRSLGTYLSLSTEEREKLVEETSNRGANKAASASKNKDVSASLLIQHLANDVVTGSSSVFRGLAPPTYAEQSPILPSIRSKLLPQEWTSAKRMLDAGGPEALVEWVKHQQRVLLTDTTMRDAHQSLFATRARSVDLVGGARIANELLKDCFSFEAWGGATFDVCMRFLDECPWERLREIRKACPDVCLQMLIRGANAVGYTSYPDNVVAEFV